MRRYLISVLFLIVTLGLNAQETKVRHYSVIFKDLEIWTIGSCTHNTGLKKSEEDEIFKHICSNIDSCKVYYTTTVDYPAKNYRYDAQSILLSADYNAGEGKGHDTVEAYKGRGALHIPFGESEGKVIVYNSEGDMILRILYKDESITSFEVRKDGTSMYKAEGAFQTLPFESTVMYEFSVGKIYYKGKLRTK